MRYALIYIIASQLVSLQDVFHLAVQFSKYKLHFKVDGGLKWTRTTDLPLIRRVL